MTKKTKTVDRPPDDKEQSARFVETAKALESDASGKSFERTFRKIQLTKTPVKRLSVKEKSSS